MAYTLTVGIPAYNEEGNIQSVLDDVFLQDTGPDLKIREVLVYSDGSTDRTNEIVRRYPSVVLMSSSRRRGISAGLNALMERAQSDVFVLLNADIRIPDRRCFRKLAGPAAAGQADLTSARIMELPPRTLVESVLASSMAVKKRVYARHRNGNNIYTCFGPARAFSRQLYSRMRYACKTGDDAFSYLYAVSNGYRFLHVPEARLLYRLPATFADHRRQSVRFFRSRRHMEDLFGRDAALREYALPVVWDELFRFAATRPIHAFLYAWFLLVSYIETALRKPGSRPWEPAASSKLLVRK